MRSIRPSMEAAEADASNEGICALIGRELGVGHSFLWQVHAVSILMEGITLSGIDNRYMLFSFWTNHLSEITGYIWIVQSDL